MNRPFSNQQGERETDFINCVVWRKPAENVANYLKKGTFAGVDGRIQTRNYEGQDGKRVYVTEVLAESVQFLKPKRKPIRWRKVRTRHLLELLHGRSAREFHMGGYQNNVQIRTNNQNQNRNPNQGHTRVDQDPFEPMMVK